MAAANQAGPIAVYGATGFTGKLVARELRRREADFLIAGRNPEKLRALSAQLDGVGTKIAWLDDPAALRALLEPCAAVIACAGPFTLYGEPLLAAAAETGTHYLDTTGEQPFIRMVFERYGERAARSGAALIPAMGFDYALGDMIAALAARGIEPLDEIVVAYRVQGFGPTRGTALSALQIFAGEDAVWRDGAWQPAPRSIDGGRWRFPEPVGEKRTLRYPAGEQITVPKHVQTASVRTLLSGMALPPPPFALLTTPALGLMMRTPARHAVEAVIKRMPEGPSEERRRGSSVMIDCRATAGSRSRRGTVRAQHDPYDITAAAIAQGALLAAAPSFDRAGALAPTQAFDPGRFLDSLAVLGIEHSVEPAPEASATG